MVMARTNTRTWHDPANHLIDALEHQLLTRRDSVAVVAFGNDPSAPPRSLTWHQLATATRLVAGELSSLVGNDASAPRIGHASDNTLSDLVIALAVMMIGAVEVPLDHRLGQREIRKRWNRVGGWWLENDQRAGLVGDALGKTDSGEVANEDRWIDRRKDLDQPSLILWTSGTTGRPQGVTLSQRNLAGNAAAKLAAVPQRPDDVRLCVLPLSHAYARTCDFGTWLLSGCTLAVSLGFDGWQRLAPIVRPTLANTVPRLAERLLGGDRQLLGLQRLRLLGCGGAAMSEDAFVAWKQRGVTVIQGYGLTESSPVICSATPTDAKAGWVGRLVDGWQHDIRDGRLFVRGSHVMLGYWNDADATRAKVDSQGWLDTGDLVDFDSRTQQLRILGRADDVIVLDSGHKINPRPIEQEAEEIEGVSHAMLAAVQGRLELWFDEQSPVTDSIIESLFRSRPSWQRPHRIGRFQPPLSPSAGELTAKGTIRRNQIAENRFDAK